MATLGKTSNGTGQSSSSANKTVVSLFTADANGVLASGAARLWVDAGSASVQLVVYADSAGAPGALLALSDSESISNTSETEIAFDFSGADQIDIDNGTSYWLGFTWADPGTNAITWSRDATASQAQQNSSNAADPFGSPTALSGPIDVYVNHFPSTNKGGFFALF